MEEGLDATEPAPKETGPDPARHVQDVARQGRAGPEAPRAAESGLTWNARYSKGRYGAHPLRVPEAIGMMFSGLVFHWVLGQRIEFRKSGSEFSFPIHEVRR